MKTTHPTAPFWGQLTKSLEIGKHIAPYARLFTQPTKKTFRCIIEEMLSMKSPNATELSWGLAKSISSISYFFTHAAWDHRKIEVARKRIVAQAATTRSTEDDVISLDATTISKTGTTFPDLSRVFDTAERKVTDGYYFYCASLINLRKSHSSIADWLLIAPNAYHFRSLWQGWLRILRRVFVYSKAKMVVLDAGFRNQYLLKFIMQNGRHFLIRVTGSMVIRSNDIPLRMATMKKHRAHRVRFGNAVLTVRIIHGVMNAWKREIPETLSVVVIHRTGFRNPLILATNENVTTPKEAVRLYQLYLKRWSIEILFKDLKMELGLEKFRVRSMVAILRYLTLVVVAHTVLVLKLGRLMKKQEMILLLESLLRAFRKIHALLIVSLKKIYEMLTPFLIRFKINYPLQYSLNHLKSW